MTYDPKVLAPVMAQALRMAQALILAHDQLHKGNVEEAHRIIHRALGAPQPHVQPADPNGPQHQDDPLLDEKKTAELLDVKPETLSVWRSTKRYALPYVKIGSKVRYRRSSVLKFIEANTKPT